VSELDAPERALLALANDAHDPTDADRARVRAALAARLGTAAGLGVGAALGAAATAKAATTGVATTAKAVAAGASGLGSTGTAAAVTGGALATKLVVAVALTATVGVGATVRVVRHRSHGPAPAAQTALHDRRTATVANRPLAAAAPDRPRQEDPAAAAPAEQPSTGSAPPARRSPAAPATPQRTAEPAPAIEAPTVSAPPPSTAQTAAPEDSAKHSVRSDSSSVAATVSNHPLAPATSSRGQACGPARADLDGPRPEFTVADEARLVHDGVRALHDGQAACALSLLDTHAHFYPHGVLAEERDAERAFALADLGRVKEARAAAAAFLRAHPTSPLGARLRQRIPGSDAANGDTTGGTPHP